jgi:hypothetical protein
MLVAIPKGNGVHATVTFSNGVSVAEALVRWPKVAAAAQKQLSMPDWLDVAPIGVPKNLLGRKGKEPPNHATFCGNRRRATASGDPVGGWQRPSLP